MTNVEQNWFQRIFLGLEVDFVYHGQRDRDREFNDLDGTTSDQVERDFLAVCEQSRAIGEAHDLDEFERRSNDEWRVNLRWIYVHLIEEYARHCGHADLLRERIDGATGD
jgi:hypothetical protein